VVRVWLDSLSDSDCKHRIPLIGRQAKTMPTAGRRVFSCRGVATFTLAGTAEMMAVCSVKDGILPWRGDLAAGNCSTMRR
jgi:hypothetical protein